MACCLCSLCCVGIALGAPFLLPIWFMGSQCGDGFNTLAVQVESVRIKGKAQDNDEEDDLTVSMVSGLCKGSSNKFHLKSDQTATNKKSKDTDDKDLDLGSVNIFFNYPFTLSLTEADILSDDRGSNEITVTPEHIKSIKEALDSKQVNSVNVVGFIVVTEQNPLETLKGLTAELGLEDMICVSALDAVPYARAGKAGKVMKVAVENRNGLQDVDQVNESPVGSALATIDMIEKATKICPVDILSSSFRGGTATYEVTLKFSLPSGEMTWLIVGIVFVSLELCCLCAGLYCVVCSGKGFS